MLEDNINLDQLKQDLYKRLVTDGDICVNEVEDEVIYALKYGDMEIPNFQVYGDGNHVCVCKNVKNMGNPDSSMKLNDEEAEELQWAWDARVEAFHKSLEEKYGPIDIVGRSGGYWGFDLDNIHLWDLVSFDIDQQTFDSLFDKVINNLKSNEDWIYDENDIEDSILSEIKDNPSAYISLTPTDKLLNFDRDIEEEAKRWESMDFTQFVSLM